MNYLIDIRLGTGNCFFDRVSAQRQQYKTIHLMANSALKRSSPLTQERINLLNEIGFTWTIRSRDTLGESWNQRLEELKRFKEKHGHCQVPSRYAEAPELGIWVGTQRTQYRLFMRAKETGADIASATSMNENRINLLEELGFVWALRTGPKEDETLTKLVESDDLPTNGVTVSTTSHQLGIENLGNSTMAMGHREGLLDSVAGRDGYLMREESNTAHV
jgi:hypothetical protein